jgi:hypothetical protein
MSEVELFMSDPRSFYDGMDWFHDPYAVIYQIWKTDVNNGQTREPFEPTREGLIVYISRYIVPQNVTLFCYYGQDTPQTIPGFTVYGDNVLRYLQELKGQKCWEVAPPEYGVPLSPTIERTPIED